MSAGRKVQESTTDNSKQVRKVLSSFLDDPYGPQKMSEIFLRLLSNINNNNNNNNPNICIAQLKQNSSGAIRSYI